MQPTISITLSKGRTLWNYGKGVEDEEKTAIDFSCNPVYRRYVCASYQCLRPGNLGANDGGRRGKKEHAKKEHNKKEHDKKEHQTKAIETQHNQENQKQESPRAASLAQRAHHRPFREPPFKTVWAPGLLFAGAQNMK